MKATHHRVLASFILGVSLLWNAAPHAGSRPARPAGDLGPPPGAPTPQPQDAAGPSSEYYGVMSHWIADAAPRVYGAMAAAGVRWARESDAFSRALVNPGPGQYDWSSPDYVVNEAVQNNIQLIGVLWITPAWDSMLPPTDPMYWTTPPRSYEQWGDYVFQTVSRYKDRVHYWEVWNEEDITEDGWWSGTPGEYARLLAVAHTQVKRADPAAQVLIGGFMGGAFNDYIYDDAWFLDEIISDPIYPAHDNYDIMNIHAYGTSRQVRSQLDEWWQVLGERGIDDRPLWVTEIGWPSTGPDQQDDPDFCCGPEAQARYLQTLMPELVQSWGVQKVFWFAIWIENNPDAGRFLHYGLLDFLLQPTQAYDALKGLIASPPPSSFSLDRAFMQGANGRSRTPSIGAIAAMNAHRGRRPALPHRRGPHYLSPIQLT